MKILFLSSPSFADCDFPYIKELQAQGHEVDYLMMLAPFSGKSSTLFSIKNLLPVDGIIKATKYKEITEYLPYMDLSHVYIINHSINRQVSWKYLKVAWQVFRFIRKGNYDVVHTDCIWGWFAHFYYWGNKNTVLTVHDPIQHSGVSTPLLRLFRHLAFSKVKKFVLLNTIQKTEFIQKNHLCENQVLINRLGIYDCITNYVKPTYKKRKNNILFFGHISSYKGIEYLCEAFLEVEKAIPDATLTIAGGGQLYFDFSKFASDAKIELKNHYIGMAELAELLFACDIVVCPYKDATQSGVVMTAFSMQKPVVASNVGGLSESIVEGQNGLLVPPCNSQKLAEAIIDILQDDGKQMHMQRNIYNEFFKGEYSWQQITQKYIEFYKK